MDPNEVVGERDVVLLMDETTLKDYSEFLSFCDTMENTTNPMNNMSEFFAPLDDKRKKEMSKIFFNSSPNDPKRTYEVSRHDILKDLFNLYCTHYPGNELRNIAFIGEVATGDGVTREVYSVFFKDLFLLKTAGLEASVPIALNSKEAESLGSMITNSFINNNFFPVRLAKATFEYLVFGDVRNSTLIESFKLCLQSNERSILEKVLKSINVCDFDWQILWDALIDAGTSSKPDLSNIMEIVLKTAKNVFYEKPCFLLTHVKKGLGEFWEDISKEAIDTLWTMYTPTHSNVLEYLNIEVTSPMEEKTEAYISRYLHSLDRDSLSSFVQFCTGSSTIEPGSSSKIVFANQDDRNFVFRAAA